MRAPDADTSPEPTESQARTDSQIRNDSQSRTQTNPRMRILTDPDRQTTTPAMPALQAPTAPRETVFDVRDVSVFYGAKRARRVDHTKDPSPPGYGRDRAFRMR